MLKIVIPCAGLGSRFRDEGYDSPKPLIDVGGKPMIQVVVDSMRPKRHDYQFVFIVQKSHCESHQIDKKLKEIEPSCEVVVINGTTEGSGITVLAAAHLLYKDEVIVSVCDMKSDFDIDDFIDKTKDRDGMMVTFETEVPHFCFTLLDEYGWFVKCLEKTPISTHAHAGVWYFSNGARMLSALTEGITLGEKVNNEYYSTIAYNHLGKNIGIYNAKTIPLGTPKELKEYLGNTKTA